MANILGEPFDDYVKEQVEIRQKSLGKYGNILEKDLLAYNTKAPFLRLASSVDLTNIGSEGNTLENSVLKKLVAAGFNEDEISGDNLSKLCILHGGVSSIEEEDTDDGPKLNFSGLKSGLTKKNPYNGAYGWGGDSERGYVPMPGIKNASVTYYNNGALSKTVIDLVCYSKKQFAIIDVLFMRPGYSLLLEFGHTVYLDNEENLQYMDGFTTPPLLGFLNGNNGNDIIEKINKEKKDRNGNYEAVLGRISKFNWQFQPDGSYSCQIELTGIGSIIESLKTNLSLTSVPTSNIEDTLKILEENQKSSEAAGGNTRGKTVNPKLASNANKSLMHAWLFSLFQDKTIGTKVNGGKKLVGTVDYTLKNFKSTSSKPKSITFKNGLFYTTNAVGNEGQQINPRVYVKYGVLLAWIQSNLLLYDANQVSQIEFDMDFDDLENDKNYILNIPGQISTEPLKALIPYRNFSFTNDAGDPIQYKKTVYSKILDKTKFATNENYLGRIASIVISIDFLSDLLDGMKVDEDGNVKLLDFLEAINDGIIKALGNINKFRFKLSQDGLKIKIIEEIPQRFNSPKTNFTKINAFGVKPGVEGSFVRNVNLTADLSNDFAAMIAIGAQSSGNSIGSNATAFSNYNSGLLDRVYPEKLSNEDSEAKKNSSSNEISHEQQIANLIISTAPTFGNMYKFSKFIDSDIQSYHENMSTALSLALGIYTDGTGKDDPQLPSPFFLPFNLSLTLDGISGPKLYQKFKVSDEILPPSYEEDGVSLQLQSLNHKIGTDGWLTEMETLSVPNNRKLGPVKQPPALKDDVPEFDQGPYEQSTIVTNEGLKEKYEESVVRLRLTRFFGHNKKKEDNGLTAGYLEVLGQDGATVLYTLATSELGWLNNKNKISCIPSGNYLVRSHVRPPAKPGKRKRANDRKCFFVVAQEDNGFTYNQIAGGGWKRDWILIHDAPRAAGWLHGCIAPGFKFNPSSTQTNSNQGTGQNYSSPAIDESIAAMKTLLDTLWVPKETDQDYYFRMEIKNEGGVADGTLPNVWSNVSSIAKNKGLLPNPYNKGDGGKFTAPKDTTTRQNKEQLKQEEAKRKSSTLPLNKA